MPSPAEQHQSQLAEHVTRVPTTTAPAATSWWHRYASSLDGSSISQTARQVIEADSRYIVDRGVFGAGAPADGGWPLGRVRRGLVMGAVQSGKTASMLGAAALSIDAGVDMVVVLAGTRVTLWRQTMARLMSQLDLSHEASPPELARRRLLLPDPQRAMSEVDVSPAQLYATNGPTLRRAITNSRPIVAVLMKNVHHLRAMSDLIERHLIPILNSRSEPFHMLVLDDEADDGSILDARVEESLDPSLADLKQIPRTIVDLWAQRPNAGTTASPHLYATYIGYTATPQANFLQSDHNPLAPREFAISLRTPFDTGDLEPRSSTFREPKGLDAFYTGGECFYRRVDRTPLCVPTTADPDADLVDALRGFLVAGAVKLWREPGRLGPARALEYRFESRTEALRGCPRPHSMLLHPSAAIADQFDAAGRILDVLAGGPQVLEREEPTREGRALPVRAVVASMDSSEQLWIDWLDRYLATAEGVREAFDLPNARAVPAPAEWPALRDLLIEEVLPAVRIKVVNSDPRADERPQFEPVEDDEGRWRAPSDLCTIFVSGNVMSRGLTLEGLTTTLFLRTADDPLADTQMQMQRWFGYRGRDLELCRVFLPRRQLDLFRAYHDTDEALRRTVIAGMNERADAPDPFVLQGRDFTATGKLANVANVPLCPGPAPFVRLVNSGTGTDPNVEVIARAFSDASASTDVIVAGRLRGRILREPLELAHAADLLDELRYERHRPTPDGWEGRRWRDLEAKVGINDATDPDRLLPFFRPPIAEASETTPFARGGPYVISAYLRLWKACLTRRARGLVATDDPVSPWSMVDLDLKSAQQPRFYVGIRYGSAAEISDGTLASLPFKIKAMERTILEDVGVLEAGWGSRNPGAGVGQYLGDELFDYHFHGEEPPAAVPGEVSWRPPGSPGLILFHVVQRPDGHPPTVAVGVGLPLGGPDQFAARGPGTTQAAP